jgi:G6PDH family F420-dependent oxidoreductase
MTRFGYFLSCEEFGPSELIEQARMADYAGFEALWISDHFHPWNDAQGNSPFVWSVIGALSQTTKLPICTAVTCPIGRMHPAIVAQAAATSAVVTGGKFTLGIGTGEALNEHVVGMRWPSARERREMLEEAVEIMRELWTGKVVDGHWPHYTVDTARLYTLPSEPPKIYMSGFGPHSIKLAARIADGYISTKPEPDALAMFRDSGGAGKTTQAGLKVCWGRDAAAARKTVHERWPNELVPGEAAQLLPMPRHFEQLSALVTEDMIASTKACGDDVREHVGAVKSYVDAGFDEVYIAQIGPEQEGFFEFYRDRVLPELRET